MPTLNQPDIANKLAELQQLFKQALPNKINEIELKWKALIDDSQNATHLAELHRNIHSLVGSAGTYGALAVSTIARKIEFELKPLLNTTVETLLSPSPLQANIDELLVQLHDAAATWVPTNIPYIKPVIKPLRGNNLIYLAEDDELLAPDLVTKLEDEEYEVRSFSRLKDFEQAFEKEIPAVIIMDVVFQEGHIAGTEVISRLQEKLEEFPPVIFISVRDDLESRLAAARAGARRYFRKPIEIRKLVQTLDGLTAKVATKPYRVLLIDDDEASLNYYTAALNGAGMVVKALSNPIHGLTELAKFQPDITVMDVYMPECSGPELAQVIRQDDAWAMMPIMFLSAESDLNVQLAAMDLGGDDFLMKPVEANHLISAISARAKRARRTNRLNNDLQNALRESKFQTITMDQHVISSTADASGKITDVNNKFCDVSGYSRKELIGQQHSILKSGLHSKRFYNEMWATISSGEVWSGIFCNKNKQGKNYWTESTIVPFLDDDGKPYKYVSARTDITSLVEIEQRFSFAIEGAGDGIWDWNMLTGEMLFSGNYEGMLGYKKGELEPSIDAWVNSVHPDDVYGVQNNRKECLTGVKNIYSVELRLRCKDKRYKWVLCRGTVVARASTGEAIRMIGIHSDISLRKKMEQSLIDARQDADNANKAKSEFLASMSHELRTPLNAILGFGQLLKIDNRSPLNTSQTENVNEILNGGQHLLGLINEVLDLSKIESGNIDLAMENVLVGDAISQSLQMIIPLAQQRGITIELYKHNTEIDMSQLVQQVETVQADITRLKQVLLNLLSNAVKYNCENGCITVSYASTNDNQLRIEVRDTGKGLSTEQQAQLFRPFSRLGAEQTEIEGTGIGLVITKNIVELMGGKIGVESHVGTGSTFWIELPEHSSDASKKDEVSKVAKVGLEIPKDINNKKVLYIEDNQANLRLVSQLMLSQPHIHLLTANEPIKGLELVSKHLPDLILLDINLPGMSGFEVLQRLQNNKALKNIPVVAISANAMPKDIERGIEAGFNEYITKPIDINKLMSTVLSELENANHNK